MSEALNHGISRYMLYALRDKGIITQVSRGIYRLADLPPIKDPDLVTVSLRFPRSVICLVSALAFHELTTQVPHAVSVAVLRSNRLPSLSNPPVLAYRFSEASYGTGIEEHLIDGVTVRVYNPEKSIVDSFKFRNKIGTDVVLEALKLYRSRRTINISLLLLYGKACRVDTVMRPYLEAML